MRNLRPVLGVLLLGGLFLPACSGKTSSSDEQEPTGDHQAATSTDEAVAQTPPASSAAEGPLAGKSTQEICENDELLLIKAPYVELAGGGWKELCCSGATDFSEGRCELDWPFSDVPSCEAWAFLRNGIYARYGYPFQKTEWQAEYGKWDWYTRDEAFNPDRLPDIAKANIALLKRFEAEGHHCLK